MMFKTTILAGTIVSLLGQSSYAFADDASSTDIDWKVDGLIAGGALAGTLLMMLVPVDKSTRWDSELFGPIDINVRKNFSRSAASLSDGLVGITMAAPLLLQFSDGVDKSDAEFALVYGETLATSLLLMSIAKYTVRRPRPYVYNPDPKVKAYAVEQSGDAHLSFYSGHASLSFSAAVAGSYLFAQESDNTYAKASVWGFEMGMATATSLLRVKAGKHYYSDIFVGAITGTAIGLLVPALHTNGSIYRPSSLEWGAMALGIGLGGLFGQLYEGTEDLDREGEKVGLHSMRLAPLATKNGGGLSLSGAF